MAGGGLVLGAGRAGLSAENPCPRRGVCTLLPEFWWLEQGLPLSMDTRYFVQGWPGIPLFPGLGLPHMPTRPWLGLQLPSCPLAPTLTLAGRGRDPSWLSQSSNHRAPQQGCSAGLDGAHWNMPLKTDAHGQVWQLAPPQAGGSRLARPYCSHRPSSNTSAVPGQWVHDVGFAQMKHLRAPSGFKVAS